MPEDPEEFAADLYPLYRAGRVLFPEIASIYADMTTDVHNTTGYATSLFEGVDQGNTEQDYRSGAWRPAVEPAHRKLLALRDDLQGVFRETSIILRDTGAALVAIADSYRTDEEVERYFLEELAKETAGDIREQYDQPPPDLPDPPDINDPYPPVPPR